MFKLWSIAINLGVFIVASLSSSTHYSLNSYAVGSGGTNSAASTTYHAQANVGEISGSTSSTHYNAKTGAIQAEQLSVPLAPSLSNGSGTFYNELLVTVTTTNEPSDATYAIAVSSNSFVTTYYVQTNGTLGSSPVYQSYTAWNSGSGTYIIGLSNSTTYQAEVSAMQGQYTNTELGAAASSTTTAPSITFSVSPTSISLGNLTAGSVITSGTNITASLTTDAEAGANVFVRGLNGGLHSSTKLYTINGTTGNLASLSEGFGLQGVSAGQSSGGPLSLVGPYNLSANNVGTDSTTFNEILTTPNEVTTGSSTIELQAKSASTDPAGTDYSETLTFSASASF